MMAQQFVKSPENGVSASRVRSGTLPDAKAALVLSAASIALTGAFAFGLTDEARSAIHWLMPVGSIAGLTGAAMSLRAKPVDGLKWLAAGTVALGLSAAVSTGVFSATTALAALGAFAAGLAVTMRKPEQGNTVTEENEAPKATVFDGGLYFDEMLEIDPRSKVLSSMNGSAILGSCLIERVHIGDRPAFLLACSKASQIAQDLNVKLQTENGSGFANTQIIIKMNQGKLVAGLRSAVAATKDNNASRELAHDLRTPLAAMIGFAEALTQTETCTAEMHKTYPGLIAATGRDLIELTAAILEPQSGQEQRQSKTLKQSIEDSLTVLKPMADKKTIAIFNRVPPALSGKQVDGVHFGQIITNLVSNSIKFSPQGASVEISAAVSANGWLLKVADNGHGISPEDVARLGQKNFRSDKAAGIAGYGLGLSIVRRLVDQIGAQISFESRPGNGTQVTIVFPASSLIELSSFQPAVAKADAGQNVIEFNAGEKHAAA